jgi:hypothetical protein
VPGAYRNEAEHLRAKVASLESDLADARAALKKDAPLLAPSAPRRRVRRRRAESAKHTLAGRLMGAPVEVSSHRSVDGLVGPGGHEAVLACIQRRKGKVGSGGMVGRTFNYAISDRNDRHLFEVSLRPRNEKTLIDLRDSLAPYLAALHLVGVGVTGWLGAAAVWFLTDATAGVAFAASFAWLAFVYFITRALSGSFATRRARALSSLADEIAETCAAHLPERALDDEAEDLESAQPPGSNSSGEAAGAAAALRSPFLRR